MAARHPPLRGIPADPKARRRYKCEGGEVEDMAVRPGQFGRIGAVLSAAALAAGCSSIVSQRGFIADEVLLQSIQPGVDNRVSVERTLGRPSFASQFGQPVWYYVGSNTTQKPFTTPRIAQHAVLAVHFDDAGNVISTERSGIEQVAQIDPVNDKTPTLGRERGFLEELFGNIGTVSSAGAGGS
jgi:outer membrane protein assembly factor BamE (lipoprotein component of BamABCDE complex)